jgi:hypothetical protein
MSAVAIGGLGLTVYFSVKGTIEAVERVEEDLRKERTNRETAELVWDCYVPAALTAVSTTGLILMAYRVGDRRAGATQAALLITERAYSEYRDRVVQELGESREQKIRDEIAAARIQANPADESLIIATNKVLCCELYTGRYFECDMETIRQAVNTVNAEVLHNNEATLDELYYLIGLEPSEMSGQFGWTSDRLLELTYTSVLTDKGVPCLAFSYNYTRNLLAR